MTETTQSKEVVMETKDEYRDDLYIMAPPKKSRETFFSIMEKRVKILNRTEFLKVAGSDHFLAHFSGKFFRESFGTKGTESPYIYVNKDDFIINGEDFTDLMLVTVRHEIEEMWLYAKTGFTFSPTPQGLTEDKRRELGHKHALRREYRFAFEIGKAERYLEFIKLFSEKFPPFIREAIVKENQEAFEKERCFLKRLNKSLPLRAK